MTPASQVSVVIPAYNAQAFVADAIESALAQTFPPAEIIVVDDGSTDGTIAEIARFEPCVKLLRQNRGGVASARNLGIRNATGDYVAFLDADDFWHPRKLELQFRVLACQPQLGLIGTSTFDWPTPNCPLLSPDPELNWQPVEWSDLAVLNYFANSSIVVRRSILDEVGPFDTNLQGPEDYDLWLRCTERTSAANLNLPLTGYRQSPGGLGSQPVAMSDGLRRIRARWENTDRMPRGGKLHRKAASHADFACAYLFMKRKRYREAFQLATRSLFTYPLPFRKREIARPAARMALTLAIVRRWLKSLILERSTASDRDKSAC